MDRNKVKGQKVRNPRTCQTEDKNTNYDYYALDIGPNKKGWMDGYSEGKRWRVVIAGGKNTHTSPEHIVFVIF